MRRFGLISLGLHIALLVAALLWFRDPPARDDAASAMGTVELVLLEQQGDADMTTAPPEAASPIATPAPPPPLPPVPQRPAPLIAAEHLLAGPPVPQTPAPLIASQDLLAGPPVPQPPAPLIAAQDLLAGPPAAPAAPPTPPPPPPPPAPPSPPTQRAEAGLTVHLSGNSDANALVTGPNVVPASIDAKSRNRPPVYPPEAARRGDQGAVVLLIRVSPEGLPSSVEVAQSSGFSSLDRAARDAVATWRFLPAVEGGRPIAFEMLFRVVFHLN